MELPLDNLLQHSERLLSGDEFQQAGIHEVIGSSFLDWSAEGVTAKVLDKPSEQSALDQSIKQRVRALGALPVLGCVAG
jgi:hypothetical protein